jgi:signal transduction histidine kinase
MNTINMSIHNGQSMGGEREVINAVARLRWLMGLRWLALVGVSVSASLAVIGLVPGINLVVMLLGVFIGIGSNMYIQWGLSHRDQVDIEGLHVGQALFDTLVLSLVLWSAGGADCPFTSFYVFPVLLSVLLSARRTFWPTAIASIVGLLWQELASMFLVLRVGEWNPIEPWGEFLNFTALILTIGMVAYFAARFTEAIREQVKAKRAADELLRLSFERLEAGVEVIEGGTTVWQNPFARTALGERRYEPWRCPGQGQGIGCDRHGCGMNEVDGGLRCRFAIEADEVVSNQIGLRGSQTLTPIYEVMLLSPPDMKQKVAIYIDQTSEVLYQRKLMNTERLASLGRTAQGVAHELNTPLATIQTLGRDVLEVLEGDWSGEAYEDVRESTQVILEEVQRCSRITHALLGRSEPNSVGTLTGQMNTIVSALNRAIALVFPHESHRVINQIDQCGLLHYPFDPLVQIFVNLIQNAHDAIVEKYEGQDIKELPKIEVIGLINYSNLSIDVIDQGGGISVESALLFEPFYTTKSIGQGTGLGLYTSYALAQELGGELSISNNKKGGVTATLTLPLLEDILSDTPLL